MRSELKKKRRLLSQNFDVTYLASSEITQSMLINLADLTVVTVLPKEVYTGGKIRDIQGGDPQANIEANWLLARTPKAEELFYLSGIYHQSHEDKRIVSREPFSVSLITSFFDFDGVHHIRHRAIAEAEGGILNYLLPNELLQRAGRIVPAEVEYIKYSCDLFKSKRTPFFGFSPRVYENITFEASKTQFRLQISAEDIPTVETILEDSNSVFQNVSNALKKILNFDPSAEILK